MFTRLPKLFAILLTVFAMNSEELRFSFANTTVCAVVRVGLWWIYLHARAASPSLSSNLQDLTGVFKTWWRSPRLGRDFQDLPNLKFYCVDRS